MSMSWKKAVLSISLRSCQSLRGFYEQQFS
jgi:hypothetical protein